MKPVRDGGLAAARTVAALRVRVRNWRAEGLTISLVPTMGALHKGHVALIEAARRAADRVVVSIYVNPTQFDAGEDFSAYPRNETGDIALLDDYGVDLLYAPETEEMYPEGFVTTVHVAGLTEGLCGAIRPNHFGGVTTVVAKLFSQVRPDAALFGEKDYQQLCIIRRLARDLDMGVSVMNVPTIREKDGLAVSSRNIYLSDSERRTAPAMYRVLTEAERYIAGGAVISAVCAEAKEELLAAGFSTVDYVDCVDGETLMPLTQIKAGRSARILAAAHIGRARLIDNVVAGL